MKIKAWLIILISFSTAFLQIISAQKTIRHFIFFSQEREAISDSAFLLNPNIAGAQITYPWKRLEPQKDKYDFSDIEHDLNFLESKGKKIFIQIQDVTFDSTFFAVPKYILTDPVYNGGVNSQYETTSGSKLIKAGWVARRWDPEVSERFLILLKKLAIQFDGRIEGINLPETAVDFPEKEELLPSGFTYKIYVDAIRKYMLALRTDFIKSTPIIYANFMPGDSKEGLIAIYDYAREIGLGVGGPDIMVYRKFQMKNSYPLIRNMSGIVTTGMAVQDGNYSVTDPNTGKQVTIPEIYDFAKNYLKLSYIFWCTEEPYYSKEVLPFIRSINDSTFFHGK
jgi:hypothetical protein